MGKIIKDFAETELAKIVDNLCSLSGILPKYRLEGIGTKEIIFTASFFRCKMCAQILALVLRSEQEEETHIILKPCTRIVIGIHPKVRKKIEKFYKKEIPFGKGEVFYFCDKTFVPIPEFIVNLRVEGVDKLAGRMQVDPIIDMREYDPNKGCYITITEFPINKIGRFMNYQTDFRHFALILTRINLPGFAPRENYQ